MESTELVVRVNVPNFVVHTLENLLREEVLTV